MIHSHKDLIVWQKSMDLVVLIYGMTESFPKSELYGLTSQMRRAVISIPSNIAEGRRRGSKNQYSQFVNIAYASGAELETQIEIAKRLKFTIEKECRGATGLLDEIMRMLNKISSSLKSQQANP